MYSITVNGIKFNLTSPTQKELDKIPKEELTKIGARIRHLRENSNLTQADMAHILNRTSQAYGNIEAGNVKCLIADDIEIICKKLNTTYHYLIGYTSDPAYGSTYTYCIQNNDKCNKELTNSSETMCYMCEKNINRKNCFMREIDTYTNEV
ncbi:MAG: helix-turn-helix transcriptional regulator, partial [Clostridia bacterium]|nr:helix-turn-helix transcriptional regulator [Clostridia bacterium]